MSILVVGMGRITVWVFILTSLRLETVAVWMGKSEELANSIGGIWIE